MMKSRILILGAVALLAPVGGCVSSDDLLDIVSPTTIADDIYWTQEKDAQLWLSGTYVQLPSADEVIRRDAYTDNGGVNRQFDADYPLTDGTNNPQTAPSRDRWNQYYSGIARANALLANIDRIPAIAIDSTRKKRYVAEAKFLRGVFYLHLVALFGDIPMPLEPVTPTSALEFTNTPAAQVYDQIIADFDAAAAVLPTSYTGTDIGRATKGAALAFKARAALYAGNWALAAEAAKAVMDMNIYSLHPDYGQLFSYAGEGSREIIFTRNYAKTSQASGQNSGIFGTFASPANSGGASVIVLRELVDAYLCTDGKPISTSPLYNSAWNQMYNNRDPRLAATVLYPGASWDGRTFDSRPADAYANAADAKPEKINLQDANASVTGYYIRKYMDLTDKGDRGNGGIDVILMRYADVLLMYAEAKVEQNSIDQSVLDAFNLVRARVGMPTVTTLTKGDIQLERRVEFAFEGLRLFDIRRWRIAEQVMNLPLGVRGITYVRATGDTVIATQPVSARTFKNPKNYLWPLPQSELDMNKNLHQNKDY